ncbi:MAG: 23S rRNA (pseudouridine(1915)-N(3))-methyltransferase RlmH [Bacteroidetes bacterium]|nr:23S rRNA (pseudouridine(1915)-N(3))-methyltransferase RlmH [Bacteroidota bacterium]MBK8658162.1 23S rRNA (pseudouridine(1915)-N(3))-methyltransferase RlmH [Bacteroidota bacterium]
MKITLIVVGKTTLAEVKSVCEEYHKRINRYLKFEETVIDNSSIRFNDADKVKEREGELILKRISATDFLILLDEKGKEFNSEQYAAYVENLMLQSHKNICFVIGGAYGFSKEVYARANAKLCLSRMTFSHQIIRILFAEQLYRAFTIIRKEPYHHQ